VSILREPMLLGHEIVGTVRRAATDGSGPTTGALVAVHPARPHPGDGAQRYPADRPNIPPAPTWAARSGKVLLTFDPALAPNRAGPPR
jgi:L-iditol 2-dehydrogenase/L-idonate 5-dehydrogenase